MVNSFQIVASVPTSSHDKGNLMKIRGIIIDMMDKKSKIEAGEVVDSNPYAPLDPLHEILTLFARDRINLSDREAMQAYVGNDLGGWMDWYAANKLIVGERIKSIFSDMVAGMNNGVLSTDSQAMYEAMSGSAHDYMCFDNASLVGVDKSVFESVYHFHAMSVIRRHLMHVNLAQFDGTEYPAFDNNPVQSIMSNVGLSFEDVKRLAIPLVERVELLLPSPKVQ